MKYCKTVMKFIIFITLVTSKVIFAFPSPLVHVPFDNPEERGNYFEGDILEEPSDEILKSGIIGNEYRWINAEIPLVLDSRFDREDTLLIATGIAHLEKYTCLRFKDRQHESDYVFIQYGEPGSGYFSSVGKRGGKQILNLEPELVNNGRFGTIVHELIHAIGFYHEQSRTDRDEYVTVNWSNIKVDKLHNVNKYTANEVDPFGVSYDYGSIMHYRNKGFAINPNIPTIITPEGISIGQRVKVSNDDIRKINNMYCSHFNKKILN